MLRKVFDWKAFDPNVNRVRPLNDFFETVDAIARPYIALLFGPQLSLNFSSALSAVATPALLFGWLRRILASQITAIFLLLIFLSSTGFLSLEVSYWHPAKKLNLAFFCAALYFAERTARSERGPNFLLLSLSLLASFFSDELGLGNFATILVLYWSTILRSGRTAFNYFLLPLIFVSTAKFLLPLMYAKLGDTGYWNAMADIKKFTVFGHLFTIEFQVDNIIQLSRSILSTVGVATHTAITETICILIFIGATVAQGLRSNVHHLRNLASDNFIQSAVALVLGSGYATLLDWYPFPYEVSYLGSFNYYYHSATVVLVIVWLAYGLRAFDLHHHHFSIGVVSICVAYLNFGMFRLVNELVQIVHYYPYSVADLRAAIRNPERTILPSADQQDQKFENDLKAVFGDQWNGNGFYRTHQMLKSTPLTTAASIKLMQHIFSPWQPNH